MSLGSNSGILYTLSSSLGYDKLSFSYKVFCLSISISHEPQFYHQAINQQHWVDAMSTEISALEQNNT
jgi:hypothetical protein